MAKKDKRIDKARANPQNVTLNDLDAILKANGFDLVRTTGSHHMYRHPKLPSTKLTIPSHSGKVKQPYVEQAIAAIDSIPEDTDD